MSPERRLYESIWRFVADKIEPHRSPLTPFTFTYSRDTDMALICTATPPPLPAGVAHFSLTVVQGDGVTVLTTDGSAIQFTIAESPFSYTYTAVGANGVESAPSGSFSVTPPDLSIPETPTEPFTFSFARA